MELKRRARIRLKQLKHLRSICELSPSLFIPPRPRLRLVSRRSRTGVTQLIDGFPVSAYLRLSCSPRPNHNGAWEAVPEPYDDGHSTAGNWIDVEGDGLAANNVENAKIPPIEGGITEYLNVRPCVVWFTDPLIMYRSWRLSQHRCCKTIPLKHRASTRE